MSDALLALLPLVAFWAVEAWAGTRAAIVAGIVLAAVDLAWARRRTGRFPPLPLFSAALVVGLGGLSLASDDPRFVLWSPVIGDVVLAGLLAGAELGRGHVLARLIAEQDPSADLHPLQVRWLDGLALRLAGNLALHAGLTAWAVPQPRSTWLFVSGPLQYVLLGAQIAVEVLWARLVVLPRVEAEEDARGQG
jgi:uncharacterized membrane protein